MKENEHKYPDAYVDFPESHYYPSWVFGADVVFANLLTLPWLEVTEARKEYFMSDIPRSYDYGKGLGRRTYHSNPYNTLVEGMLSALNNQFDTNYNVCFLNRYDDEKKQLGWHSDDSPEMDTNHPIAVVSLGVKREIWWRPIGFSGVIPKEWRQLLQHGSLFIMPPGFQELYQHKIPKCDRECGIRISLTFRRYK